MTKLTDHQSTKIIKMMLLGDSGSGKTGALASLVFAGYKLWIIDFDKGLDVLRNVIAKRDPKLLENVEYETVSDEYQTIGSRVACTKATAWAKASTVLGEWQKLGLGSKDVLVIDSITFAGKAAMNFIASLNSRLGQAPYQSDYLDGQRMLENLFALLHSDTVKYNVICITHVKELSKVEVKSVTGKDGKEREVRIPIPGTEKGLPETGTGQALSPTVGRHFNSVLLAEVCGEGAGARREIFTVPHGNVGLKNSAPGQVPARLPLETGLATYFTSVLSTQPEEIKNG